MKRSKRWIVGGVALAALGIVLGLALTHCGGRHNGRLGFQFPNTSNPLVGGFPVYNVKSYGAVGNGSTDDTNAIRSAISAAASPGGGIVFFPAGTYIVSQHFATQRCLDLASGVILWGENRATTIIKLANGQATGTQRLVYASAVSNVGVRDLTFDGNSANHTDAGNHSDAIFFDTGSNNWIVDDVEIRNCVGSGIVPFTNATDGVISRAYMHDNAWYGVAMGNTGGQKRITVRDSYFNNAGGGVRIETDTATENLLFERLYVATPGAAASALQVTGSSPPSNYASDVTVRDSTFYGPLLIANAQHVRVHGVNVINSDNSSGQTAGVGLAALRISLEGDDIAVTDSTFTLTSSSNADAAVRLTGNLTGGTTTNVRLTNNKIVNQNATADAVRIQDLISVELRGNDIEGTSALGVTYSGIFVDAVVARPMDRVVIENNYIADIATGIKVKGTANSSSYRVNTFVANNNRFESYASAGLMSTAMSLDHDSNHVLLSATAIGNEAVNGSVATMFGTYPNVPMLVGGTRSGVSTWSVSGSPESVITAPVGSVALRRDGSGITASYVKGSGAGNTGWLPAGGAVTTAGSNLSLSGQTLAVSSTPTFSGSVTVGSHTCKASAPQSVSHGSLGTGSTDCWGDVTGIGANTSTILTYSTAAANRSRCTAQPTGGVQVIQVTNSASAPTFSCFDMAGVAANCVDFNYQCEKE